MSAIVLKFNADTNLHQWNLVNHVITDNILLIFAWNTCCICDCNLDKVIDTMMSPSPFSGSFATSFTWTGYEATAIFKIWDNCERIMWGSGWQNSR
jgi:hypothetical protein